MPMQCLCTMGASNRNFRWQRTKTYNIAYWLHKKTASWRGWTNFRQVPSSRLQNIVLDTRKKNHKVPGFPLKHRNNLASTNGCQASYQVSQPRFRAGPMGDSQLTDAGAKLQSTMEANRALNSVIWLFKIIACIVFFLVFFIFVFQLFLIWSLPVANVCTCAGWYRKGLGKRDGQDAVDHGGRAGFQLCCWVSNWFPLHSGIVFFCCLLCFFFFQLLLIWNLPVANVCTCAGWYRKGLGKRDGQDAVDDGGRVSIQFCCWVLNRFPFA